MTQDDEWGRRLTAVIADQVKAVRMERGMSAQQLADATAGLGHPVARSVIANLENGRRDSIGIAEVLVLALALNVPPVLLLFPIGRAPEVEVVPGKTTTPWLAAQWFSGDAHAPATAAAPPSTADPFSRLPGWPDLTVRYFRSHERLSADWSRADADVRQAVGDEAEAATARRRGIEDHLAEYRALMRHAGLSSLPPLPDRLRAALGEDQETDRG